MIGKEAKWRKHEVDWLLYHNEVKNSASLQDGSTTLKGKLEDRAKAILEVACKHIGKTKRNRSGKNFVMPTLRKEIKLQNKLKKELPQKKEELIQTCKKVQGKHERFPKKTGRIYYTLLHDSEGRI